jgi:hypothetical protein
MHMITYGQHRSTELMLSRGGWQLKVWRVLMKASKFNLFSDKSARIYLIFPSIFPNLHGFSKFGGGGSCPPLPPVSYAWWIDKGLLHLIKNKNIQRKKIKNPNLLVDVEKYMNFDVSNALRWEVSTSGREYYTSFMWSCNFSDPRY